MAVAEIISRALGIIDGWFAISPEQRVIRYKDKIDALKKEKNELLKKTADLKSANRDASINEQLRVLEGKIRNEAR